MPKTTYQSDFHTFIAELFHEQGVHAAPDVTYQLAHFSHSFITNLRSDAHDLTAGNEGVTPEHIQLAYDLRSFTKSRIQRKDIYRFASHVNQKQFPRIEPHQGLSLPHEQHCLLANNFQYAKFEETMVPDKTVDRKRRGEDLEETDEGSSTKRGSSTTTKKKKKSAKRMQLDIDALEAQIMAQLEGPAAAESAEIVKEPIPAQAKEDDRTSQEEEQDKEIPPSQIIDSKSSDEDEEHTASNGTKLTSPQHSQRRTPETRTIVSMKGDN